MGPMSGDSAMPDRNRDEQYAVERELGAWRMNDRLSLRR
jgi:hypothetical protein